MEVDKIQCYEHDVDNQRQNPGSNSIRCEVHHDTDYDSDPEIIDVENLEFLNTMSEYTNVYLKPSSTAGLNRDRGMTVTIDPSNTVTCNLDGDGYQDLPMSCEGFGEYTETQ